MSEEVLNTPVPAEEPAGQKNSEVEELKKTVNELMNLVKSKTEEKKEDSFDSRFKESNESKLKLTLQAQAFRQVDEMKWRLRDIEYFDRYLSDKEYLSLSDISQQRNALINKIFKHAYADNPSTYEKCKSLTSEDSVEFAVSEAIDKIKNMQDKKVDIRNLNTVSKDFEDNAFFRACNSISYHSVLKRWKVEKEKLGII